MQKELPPMPYANAKNNIQKKEDVCPTRWKGAIRESPKKIVQAKRYAKAILHACEALSSFCAAALACLGMAGDP